MISSVKNNQIRVLEKILHGIMITDMQGLIIYSNNANAKIFGYSISDIRGMSIQTLYSEKDEMTVSNIMNKVIKNNPVHMRWSGIQKNSERVWLEIRANRLTGENGEPDSCIISLHKIDSVKYKELKLKKNKAFAETILDATADAIISVDTKGEIIQSNNTAVQLFGYSSDELNKLNIKKLLPFSDAGDAIPGLNDTQKSKNFPRVKETKAVKKNGETFPVELSLNEVTWDGSKMYVAVLKNLAERRKLEKQILQIGDKERKRIGSELHDNLGQLLTGIRLQTEIVARKLKVRDMPGSAEIEEIVRLLKDADEHTRLIAQGMVATDLENKGLYTAVENLCKKLEKLSGINFSFSYPEKLHIKDKDMSLNIFRIIQEAVNNALKYSHAENISVELTSNPHLTLKIEDDGDGFDYNDESNYGSGIPIMNYRANILGGEFKIDRTGENRTIVKCEFPNLTERSQN